jgi:hypothetical protein
MGCASISLHSLWQVCCGPCWRGARCVVKTLRVYAWACFVVRYSEVSCSCVPTRSGTDAVKNYWDGRCSLYSKLMTSVHSLDKLSVLCCENFLACVGARACFVVTRKSCSCIPSRADELQTFNRNWMGVLWYSRLMITVHKLDRSLQSVWSRR